MYVVGFQGPSTGLSSNRSSGFQGIAEEFSKIIGHPQKFSHDKARVSFIKRQLANLQSNLLLFPMILLWRLFYMSLVMRKPAFCICENKDADQLRGNREADQRLCFRYTDSTIPLLPKSEISSLKPSSVAVQPCLCWTRSETSKTGFLRTRLISCCV